MHAIISDIHGNLTALKAVLADIRRKGIDRIFCLGDVVGYGPNPCECIDLVRKRCEIAVCGNHDMAVLSQAFGFREAARDAIDWTREQVQPGPITRFTARGARWRFLEYLPDRYQAGRALYVHASPRNPVVEYIEEVDVADQGFGPSEKIQEIFSRVEQLCFVGHTHQPGVFTGDFKHIRPPKLDDGAYNIPEDGKTIVNVGSVGQPRDRDPRSCYVTLDDGEVDLTVRFHRVAYNVDKVIAEVGKIDKLDERLGLRLREGR